MSLKSESENNPEKNLGKDDTEIELQLGDIIQITNPSNEIINEQIFLIDYIDKSKTYLINTDSLEKIKLKISEDGVMGDGNIKRIALLSRSDTPGYAKQHQLMPDKWINIYFGGDFPIIITGEITNLEEDMIEVKTIDGDTIYINFDYKGIPEDLPIEMIEIRDKPQKPIVEEENEPSEEEKEKYLDLEDIPELKREQKLLGTENIEIKIPTKNIKDQLREFILKADQIKFGNEELGPIVQYVDVSSKSQRYSVETQVTDLLDDILSTIPNNQRTPRVLNNIHIMIERFKQLRTSFSQFDKYGNVENILIKEANYKPLLEYFLKFKQNLYWILPVIKNIKKVYDVTNVDEENSDIIDIEFSKDLEKINELMDSYKSDTLSNNNNRYASLYSDLNPFFTPFDLISDESSSSIIIEKMVDNDISVIIDNLEDMYSSIFTNNNIKLRRFVIQKYNLGLTKLDTVDSTSSRLITTRVKMTNPDIMSIKSFVTLPEPVIRFSKINLPGSNILDKANLNLSFLNYWEFLRKKTTKNDIFIDNLNDQIDFNENNFVNSIKNYVLNLSEDEVNGITKEEIYKKFVETFIPKTKILFNLMKKYIVGKLSIVEVVSYLEPFLVYPDDLTYMQYVDIISFINEKISQYNKSFIEKSRLFMTLSRFRNKSIIASSAFSLINILTTNNNINYDVFYNGYDVDTKTLISENLFTDSEILRKLLIKDCSKLYTTALSLQNIPLMFPNDISSLINSEKSEIDKSIINEESQDKCKTMIISKMYTSMDALNDDNNKPIYFDKKYDKTNYGILDSDYEKELIRMSPEDLKNYIVTDLMNKKKYSENDADYFANTLLDGHKKVLNGQYALLYKGYNENINDEVDYYVRREEKWVLDKDMSNKVNTDESLILCDLQEKCISVEDNIDSKCESIKLDELSIHSNLLKSVINEFDTRYKISKEEFSKQVKAKYDYLIDNIGILTKLETTNLLKFNNQKYKLGISTENDNHVKELSPYSRILNIILGQNDFVKKQNDIIRFVNTYTRPYIETNTSEQNYWLYCLKSGVPLLPTFKFDLATAYFINPTGYQNYLDIVISKIGKLSDDGDYWTDKNSGWPICRIDFDIEEGYEGGFKLTTRGVLEDDAGNKITSAATESIKYNTPEIRMINNIINTMSIAMGINMETQKEFIFNCVLSSLRDTLESEVDYKDKVKEMAQKGKKIASYKDFYNTAVLYYTLGMFLIAIQTSIPSIKTRKTHPGCIRSFTGYPFEGAGDLSSLKYIGCVAYDIRESGEPWNVLKGKKNDVIMNKIKGSIDDVLLNIPDVRRKIDEKTEYLLTNDALEIPEEHSIANWFGFLPPLVPFKIKNLANISSEFKKALTNELRIGSLNQREKIAVIESKIIQFSLAIQQHIGVVVKKHNLLLHTLNNEPYLENACCETKNDITTIGYFYKQDHNIAEYNTIVNQLSNILIDIIYYSKSGLFYSRINTKNKYPPISNEFNEKTIYLAFIYYCKFKSLMPIPEDLLPLCTDKPDITLINPNDSIDRIIQKLKDDGRHYSYEQFLRLIQLVARHNIIDTHFNSNEISSITKLKDLLENIDIDNDEVVERSLLNLIGNALDTFDIASEETTKEIKLLNNFLITNIVSMKEELIDFIKSNAGTDITNNSIKKTIQYINKISIWVADTSIHNENDKISNDKMYNIINFYKLFIDNFVNIFPNIILNKVNYNDVHIPNYLGYSKNHSKKLKKSVKEYYESIARLYGVPAILRTLQTIQNTSKNLVKLSKDTPCFSSIKNGDKILKPVFDERTSRFLFEYYLLRVLINYIELSDDSDMIVNETISQSELSDLVTVDYLEERETRIDLTMSTQNVTNRQLFTGNKKDLKQRVCQLLIAFIEIMNSHKETIDTSYDEIQDRVFKLREKEKDMVTDRLKGLTDETRDVDTILKINKLNQYSKGLQKGLTTLDKDFYDEEREFRDEMVKAEKNIRKKNNNVTDDNIDQLMDDYFQQNEIEQEIEREDNDMEYMNEDYYDGNTDGFGAPEEEYEDYEDFN
jgi:hypothetical protein